MTIFSLVIPKKLVPAGFKQGVGIHNGQLNMEIPRRKIKVLVVDDSALMRKLIPLIISSDRDIEIIGTAMDGDFALKKIPYLKPDVITLDVNMPRMDGLTTLKSIVKDFGIPVILVSSITKEGTEITFKALEIGAFDFVTKPEGATSVRIYDISRELINKIKLSSCYKPLKYNEPRHVKIAQKPQITLSSRYFSAEGVIAIGVSTGGPQALTKILPQFPGDFPFSILIVQHMPEGFTGIFARRLDSVCSITVKEASDGDIINPGTALIAPGGKHLRIKRTPYGVVSVLSQSPEVSGHRPSATALFNSVAEEYREKAIGIIMTGMGDDGVEGLGRIKENGGITIAQDEETSVVYGMPKVAVEKGYADIVMSLDDIPISLIKMAESKGHESQVLQNASKAMSLH